MVDETKDGVVNVAIRLVCWLYPAWCVQHFSSDPYPLANREEENYSIIIVVLLVMLVVLSVLLQLHLVIHNKAHYDRKYSIFTFITFDITKAAGKHCAYSHNVNDEHLQIRSRPVENHPVFLNFLMVIVPLVTKVITTVLIVLWLVDLIHTTLRSALRWIHTCIYMQLIL